MAKLLTLSQVEEKVGFKKTFIYKKIKDNTFPAPVKFGSSSRWSEEAIDNWINSHITTSVA